MPARPAAGSLTAEHRRGSSSSSDAKHPDMDAVTRSINRSDDESLPG
jgi:hypothetical protein